MSYVITQPCVGVKERQCVAVCPEQCIYEGPDQFFIHPEQCTDCDLCRPVCPVDAIYPAGRVPEAWRPFIVKNAEFFRP